MATTFVNLSSRREWGKSRREYLSDQRLRVNKVEKERLKAQRGSLGIKSISMEACLLKVDLKETKEGIRSFFQSGFNQDTSQNNSGKF